jgi:hypothetical protein
MVLLQMPTEKYAEDRAFEFEQLAAHANKQTGGFLQSHASTPHLALRVALSNVFVSMARQGRPRTIQR